MDLAANANRKIAASRSSGVLNLRGEGLETVPKGVYDKQAEGSGGNWWEAAELVQLILAHNEISSLPVQLFSLSSLTLIDVSYNHLGELPAEISQLPEVKSLDVSHNRLERLPGSISDMTGLVQLSCSNNRLVALPAGLGQGQDRLARLDASHNVLAELPSSLSRATSLTLLNVEENRIKDVPKALVMGLSGLVDLNIAHNQLGGCLWPDIHVMKNLRTINVRYNQFTQLPPSLAGCVSLAELHAAHNRINIISPEIGNLKTLKIMDLSDNSLTDFPPGACTMELSVLDMTNNDLKGLPPQLGLMTSLRKLALDGNPLRSIRRQLISGPLTKLLETLRFKLPSEGLESGTSGPGPVARSGNLFGTDEKELAVRMANQLKLTDHSGDIILKSLGLTEIPSDVWQAVGNMKCLDASDNNFADFSAGNLEGALQLQRLLLRKSGVKSWPLPLVENALPSLLELDVSRNRITEIPGTAFLSCAESLRELDLTGVTAVGKMQAGVLASLRKIQRLHLGMTTLAEFPRDVLTLTSLNVIDLSSNSISVIPETVTNLTNLSELNLSNNNIAHLPPRLGLMHPVLKTLMLEGNLLKTIRRPLLEKGTEAILKHLADKILF